MARGPWGGEKQDVAVALADWYGKGVERTMTTAGMADAACLYEITRFTVNRSERHVNGALESQGQSSSSAWTTSTLNPIVITQDEPGGKYAPMHVSSVKVVSTAAAISVSRSSLRWVWLGWNRRERNAFS